MKFDYGDEVVINIDAPLKYRPGEYGAVCGITIINNETLSQIYELGQGTVTYTIEYIDGTDCLVPEEYLTLDLPNSRYISNIELRVL